MGQLFTRIPSKSNQQTSSIITENNLLTIKSAINKRKRLDQNHIFKKKKVLINNNNRGIDASFYSNASSRAAKFSKFSNTSLLARSLSSMTIFKCQLCCRCFTDKDSYLDHMIICAIEHRASVKIVRAKKNYSSKS